MALPPGPRGPALFQSLRLLLQPIDFLERCLRRYGDVFTLKFIGMGDLVYVADTETVKQIFTGDPRVFHAGEANEVMEPVLGSRSVLLLDGDEHLRERRLLLPPFHGERVRRYRELVAEIAAREVERWPRGRPFSLRPRMQTITLEVILRAVFGIQEAERLDRLRALLPKMLDHGTIVVWMPFLRRDLGPGSPWRRFERVRAEVDGLLFDEIRRRRGIDLAERDDVLSMLLQARGDDGSPMGDRELRDELMTLLLAGHETTATGLAWAFERLARNPRVMRRLEEALGEEDDAYLDAVAKETLRARPVVYDVARRLAAPVTIKGWKLPAGAYVVPSITAIHLLQGIYDRAEEFRPERFLDAQVSDSYAWIPFGGGRRRCIGAAFATMEMKAVLREVLARVEVRAPDPKPERLRLHNVTLVPAKGARVIIEDRVRMPAEAAAREAATTASPTP
jgi:cytochrome P450 family 135